MLKFKSLFKLKEDKKKIIMDKDTENRDANSNQQVIGSIPGAFRKSG